MLHEKSVNYGKIDNNMDNNMNLHYRMYKRY